MPRRNDPSEPRLRDELRHTLILAFGTGVSSLLRIAYVVWAARILGPEAYADFYAVLAFVFLFATGMAPIAGTVSRFTSLHLARSDPGALAGLLRFARRQVWRIVGALAIASPLIALALQSKLRLDSFAIAVLTAAILPFALLLDLPRGVLRGALDFTAFSVNVSVEALIRLVLSVALLAWAPSAEAALLAFLIAALFIWPIGELQVRKIVGGAEPAVADGRTLARFGGNLFLVAFIGAALQNIDVLAARALFADLEAGLYGAASSLVRVIALIYLPFGIQLLPALTVRIADGRRTAPMLGAIMAAFGALALSSVAALSLLGEPVLRLLYGGDYLAARPLIAPLGAALTFALLSILLGQAFTAMSSFRFLPFYFAGLVAELAILWWTRATPTSFAAGLLISQILTFAVVLACFLIFARRPAPADREHA